MKPSSPNTTKAGLQKPIGRWLWKGLRMIAATFLLFILLNIFYPPPSLPSYSTIITDRKGQVIHAYLSPDEKWRMKTELNEISPLLRQTIVYKEDRYFYYHPGINLFAIGRAFAKNLLRGRTTSGASTITMQVVRLLEPRPRHWSSKAKEAVRALQLEWKYSKDEILQLYLNLVPMGGNLEGIKSASWLYFNKSPDHLSLAEITALSIIPNRPTSLRIGRHNNKLLEQRNIWLRRFKRANLFDKNAITAALNEPLTAQRLPVPQMAPHLSRRLQHSPGSTIASTLNMEMQWKVEKMVTDYVRPLRAYNIQQAAVVVINNATHQVEAYIGSADFYDTTHAGQVNGATAIRQPGSTLKPLLYGLAIDAGLITPKMVMNDVPINYAGYVPENYDQQFNGAITMEYALAHSLNIPAVKMLYQLGKEKMIETLVQANFKQIAKDEKKLGLSLILGGCGASLEELTGLFSALANNGKYVAPSYLMNDSAPAGKRLLSESASFMLHEILSNIERPDFPVSWQSTSHLPQIAWKTGTSYGRRDAWSIGYNPQYTIGVWLGNFSGQGIPELSGATIATPLLFRLFNSIDYNSKQQWYQPPPGLDSRIVCTESGLPPTDHCAYLITDNYIPLVSPAQLCPAQQEILLSPDEKTSFCIECAPANGYKKKWIKKIPADLQAWYTAHSVAFEKAPPHNAQCQRVFGGNGPIIKSPENAATYYLLDSQPEPILLQCNTEADVVQVYWYINDRLFKSAPPTEPIFFMPAAGQYRISCSDDKGRTKNIRIEVKQMSE